MALSQNLRCGLSIGRNLAAFCKGASQHSLLLLEISEGGAKPIDVLI
jgi:hypothetical protein